MTGVVYNVSNWLTIKPADDGDAQRLTQLRPDAAAQCEGQRTQQGRQVVITIGRKRSRQA